MIRILEEVSRHLWGLSQSGIDALSAVVSGSEQDNDFFKGSVIKPIQGLSISSQDDDDDTPEFSHGQRIGSMGVLHINGPMIPSGGGFLAWLFGLTSTNDLIDDFQKMEADSDIDRIALIVDSPGGAITGISELAANLSASSKPVAAYIEGTGASAAYWVVSAADSIVAADTARIGSIGVVARVYAGKDKDTVKIISSQSPKKQIDPSTKEGKKEYQSMVDDMANVFVNTVAENRGTTRENVIENYGQGGTFIAAKAEAKGMIDAVMTRKQFLADFGGDLEAGCDWMRKRRSAQASAIAQDNFDNDANLNTRLENNAARADETEETNERTKTMKLEELLKENADAQSEFDAAISEAKAEARTALRKEQELAVRVMAGDDYPEAVKTIAADFIKGEKGKETLDAVMAVAEMQAEKERSQQAQQTTTEQGDTPPAPPVDEPSADGAIKTTADYYKAIGKPMPQAEEVN